MKQSESIVNISKALVKAHAEIGHAQKDKENTHFRNVYATLSSVIDATKSALLKNDIVVIQYVDCDALTTRLQHSSGEYYESSMKLILSKQDMQGLGSAITYARRYSLAAMTNTAQEDDDGNEASNSTPRQVTKPKGAQVKF